MNSEEESYEDDEEGVYVQCDKCKYWYHGGIFTKIP